MPSLERGFAQTFTTGMSIGSKAAMNRKKKRKKAKDFIDVKANLTKIGEVDDLVASGTLEDLELAGSKLDAIINKADNLDSLKASFSVATSVRKSLKPERTLDEKISDALIMQEKRQERTKGAKFANRLGEVAKSMQEGQPGVADDLASDLIKENPQNAKKVRDVMADTQLTMDVEKPLDSPDKPAGMFDLIGRIRGNIDYFGSEKTSGKVDKKAIAIMSSIKDIKSLADVIENHTGTLKTRGVDVNQILKNIKGLNLVTLKKELDRRGIKTKKKKAK